MSPDHESYSIEVVQQPKQSGSPTVEGNGSGTSSQRGGDAAGGGDPQIVRWGVGRLSAQTLLVFIGKMLGAGLGFVMSLAVARWLGPEEFGLFSLFIVILIMGNDVLGDGLNPGVVRYYAMYSKISPLKASEVLTNALALRLGLGIPVVVLGAVLGSSAADTLFTNHTYAWPISLGLVGSFGAALLSFTLSAWQARQEFLMYSGMGVLVNLLRVVSLAGLLWFGALALGPIMALHAMFYYLCTFFSLWLLRPHLASFRINTALLWELLRFSKWPAIASLCFVLQVNLAVPVLTYSAGATEAGLYAAGSTLLMGIDFVTVSLLTTLLPKVSHLTEVSQWRSYVKRFSPLLLLLAIALLPFVFVARPVVIGMFGPSYEGTVPVVQILFLGALATLLTHPLYLVLYAMNRPYLFSITQGFALSSWMILGYCLIPESGAIGAAWTTLFARLRQAGAIVGMVAYGLRMEDAARGESRALAEGMPGI